MKRTTAAAVTGVTALVLAGSGAGIAVAYDHHPTTHPDRTPAVTVHVRTPQPVAVTSSRPATKPQQRHATVHPAAPQRVGTHTATVRQHHATSAQRATTTRTALPQPHHSQPYRYGDCDGWDHGGGSGYHH